jgi:hypothetical protein
MQLGPVNTHPALLSVFVIALGSLVTGCGSQFFAAELNAPPRAMASRPIQTVEVYASQPPTRPHVDVREIQTTLAVYAPGRIVAGLRAEAAREGCDAVYVKIPPTRGDRVASASATCIVYTDAAPAAASAVAAPAVATAASPVGAILKQ